MTAQRTPARRSPRTAHTLMAAIAAMTVLVSACAGTDTAGSNSAGNGSANSSVPGTSDSGDATTGESSEGSDATSPDATSPDATSPDGSTTTSGDSSTESGGDANSNPGEGTASPDELDLDALAAEAVDALSLTGPVDAVDVPDMEPVLTGVTPQLPATITDSTGKKITVGSADRVIALDLYGTLTDTIIGLGLQDRLVGRATSDTQDMLADLPVVSIGGIELNAEAVLSLHPDLILTNLTIGSDAVYQQLESAGVTVVRFDQVPDLDRIRESIDQVGAVFGVRDQADELAQHTEQRLDEVRQQIEALASATPEPPRAVVLYVRGSGGIFFILGADYGATDVLHELGLEDVAAENDITNITPANPEALVSLDPEIILTMRDGVETAGGIAGLLKRPGMTATTAGQNERIVTAADSQLLSYGPRTPDNLLSLAQAIYTNDPAS